jgi:hypothetical protein
LSSFLILSTSNSNISHAYQWLSNFQLTFRSQCPKSPEKLFVNTSSVMLF